MEGEASSCSSFERVSCVERARVMCKSIYRPSLPVADPQLIPSSLLTFVPVSLRPEKS